MAAEGGRARRVLVLGDGAWGTALARHLVELGVPTRLWGAFPEHVAELAASLENRRHLPGIPLPAELEFVADPFEAARDVELVLSAVPTQYLRQVAALFEDALHGGTPVVSATKGLEMETLERPSQILGEELGERPVAVLTGPSHAEEVARGLHASLVAASADESLAERVQATFSGGALRVYTSPDPVGAELGGALKNVIALAAGVCDGLELGDNAKSALLTRGLVEMARIGAPLGARSETFFGLAGLGDLVTTCFSRHSRNRSVGERIGRGESLEAILASMRAVAEGVWTTRALFGPESEAHAVDMPIAREVHQVLFEGKPPLDAVMDLLGRAPTGEMDGLVFGEPTSGT